MTKAKRIRAMREERPLYECKTCGNREHKPSLHCPFCGYTEWRVVQLHDYREVAPKRRSKARG
jgi:uncharacterized OB-fold protein